MRKRIVYLFILSFILLLSVQTAFAGTIIVTSTADNNLVDGACTLREAITRANAGSASADCPGATASPNTIQLANGATYTLASTLTSITTNTLTIEPASGTATVEAAATPNTATYRVFAFNSTGTLTLNNLTIRNGDTTTPNTSGGCISLLTNGTLITSGVTFTGCTTGGSGGGAISATNGGTLQITGGSFTSNESAGGTTGGGAIYINGGPNPASLTISGGVSFTSNTMNSTASGQSGGAINCILCSASISGATFTGNTASTTGGVSNGGALYFNTDQIVTISGSSFTNNSVSATSTSTGGAISVSNQPGRTVDLTISGGVFNGNTVSGGTPEGGAIYMGNGTLTITNSRIFSNNVASASGDAIYYDSPLNGSISQSCITNNGDTGVYDSTNTGTIDASGSSIPNSNWWGTSWGPRISTAGGGSAVSNGDSINGNGNTVNGNILVDVNLTSAGTDSSAPTGMWLTTAPVVAGATCQTCTSVSSISHGRTCS